MTKAERYDIISKSQSSGKRWSLKIEQQEMKEKYEVKLRSKNDQAERKTNKISTILLKHEQKVNLSKELKTIKL